MPGPVPPLRPEGGEEQGSRRLRRAETKARGPSLDAPVGGEEGPEATGKDLLLGSSGADVDYFRDRKHVRAVLTLALIEDAVFEVLTETERKVFLEVRVNGKSGAAVGRELDPPVSGQRVGQIVVKALVKISAYLKDHEHLLDEASEPEETEGEPSEGGEGDGRG